MAKNVILPALGMAQETGKIVRWLKSDGDRVAQGEAIAEIETDKVTVELEAPISGTLSQISAAAGDDVPVGQVIAVILAPDEAPAPPVASRTIVDGERSGDREATSQANGEIPAGARAATTSTAVSGRIRQASPKARRIAAERGLDISSIRGSGPNGAVLTADVLAVSATNAQEVAPVAVPEHHVPNGMGMSTVWRIMGERTTQSWTTAPHFFLMRDVRANAFVAWHAQAQKRATEKLTYTDLLVKVVATALRQHPQLNASWQNGAIMPNEEINIGLAVAVADGLVVPVIPHADDLSLNGIARQRKDLVERAQSGKLRTGDLQGGTFTISNLGMYGVDAFLAIINAPQAAILAVGALADRVVPVDGVPAVLPMMTLSLSCDHRVVDGARGAQFLATIADLIADPAGL